VCFKVANREPLAATLLHPDLPRALDAVIARAIAKNPADRYQRGMEMAMDLRELLDASRPGSQSVARQVPAREQPQGLHPEHQFAHALWAHARKLSANKVMMICLISTVLVLGLYWPLHSTHGRTATTPVAFQASDSPTELPANSPALANAAVDDSTLDLEIEHPFKDGKIWLWIDGNLEYTHKLQGESRKHLLVFRTTHGRLSQKLSIQAGCHRLGVRAQSPADQYDQRRELSCNLTPGRRGRCASVSTAHTTAYG